MLQPQELRINNYVKDEYSAIYQVLELRREGIVYEYFMLSEPSEVNVSLSSDATTGNNVKIKPYSELSGIELTLELLEKAGFKSVEGDYAADNGFKIKLNKWEDLVIDLDGCNSIGIISNNKLQHYFERDFKYLHELQNLFNDLAGNELEVKL